MDDVEYAVERGEICDRRTKISATDLLFLRGTCALVGDANSTPEGRITEATTTSRAASLWIRTQKRLLQYSFTCCGLDDYPCAQYTSLQLPNNRTTVSQASSRWNLYWFCRTYS